MNITGECIPGSAGSSENIYLIGFMGTGKSTISNCLHEKYGMEQVEMDEEIAAQQGKSIADIFAQDGEERFRELETELLRCLGRRGNVVVSCGGGTAMRECNVLEMKKRGRIVLLLAQPETVYERVHTNHDRPLLEGNMNVNYIKSLIEARMPKYQAAADIMVHTDGRSAEDICGEIMDKLSGIAVEH